MLEQNILEQLNEVFKKLENSVSLVYNESDSNDQVELVNLLNQVASTSDKIKVFSSNIKNTLSIPSFHIEYQNKKNGISFMGIPTGHEFTSLILAILNSDHKGKMPDDLIVNRIKRLKGPITLRTFISLTCENCPEVVQNLNLIATLRNDFTHEMVDGAYVQDEIERLKIQGVPSVVVGDKLVSAGKIDLLSLLEKLEKEFGLSEAEVKPQELNLGEYDIVVVGAGPAGASSAIYSARKGLKTAILAERVGGQVKDTKGIENLISVTYTEGPQLAAQLYKHMEVYPIKILEHRRVKNITNDKIKKITLESGEYIFAKSVIIATGAKWRELGIEGEKEYIGRGVAFCPHCDGPYYKNKNVSVVGGGNSGVEAAIDLANIVNHVTLFEFAENLKADSVLVEKLKSLKNVNIITNAKTQKIVGDGTKVIGMEYVDRASNEIKKLDLDGVFVQIGLLPNSQFVKELVEVTKFGEIVTDFKGRTNVKGIYAAGDVTTIPYKQIIISMGEGAKVALSAFEDMAYV